MSIIAYASASNDPTANPALDVEVDLSSVSLPQTVTVYGDAVDTSDPSATFSWAWTLLDGDGATLDATNTQDVELTLTSWNNARLHLVVTNTATSETSETNVLLAPSSSFCVAHVLSERHSIEKPAKGERGWQDALDVWADTIEASATALTELSDVSTATGATLDTLVSGGDAVSGGSALHTHPGAHVATATNTTQGTVTLEGAWHTAGQVPKMLVRERLAWTGGTDYSVISGTVTSKIVFQSTSANELLPHVVFCAHEAVRVVALNVVVMDGGLASAVGDYVFDLCSGPAGKLSSATMPPVGLDLSGTISGDNLPLVITHTLTSPLTVSVGDFVGVALRNSPQESDAGRVLQVTLHVERAI
jgi:hypothetical protein